MFIDHEKNDNCNTYIHCGGEAPYGKKCSNPKHCVFIGKDYCDECVRAICTEIPPTTGTYQYINRFGSLCEVTVMIIGLSWCSFKATRSNCLATRVSINFS